MVEIHHLGCKGVGVHKSTSYKELIVIGVIDEFKFFFILMQIRLLSVLVILIMWCYDFRRIRPPFCKSATHIRSYLAGHDECRQCKELKPLPI